MRAIFGLKSPLPAGSQHYRAGWDDGLDAAIDAAKSVAPVDVDEVREEVRREILGDDLNPSALVLDAQAYRRLRETITATMDDPDRWDQDAAEELILSEYVRWLADGKPARDDGWENETEPTHLGPDPSHGGLTTHRGRREDCSGPDCGPADEDVAPQHLTEAERAMLRYALDLAQEKIWSEDGFTDADQDAVASLKRLAGEVETDG